MAFKEERALMLEDELDERIVERLGDTMWFLDGQTWQRVRSLCKPVRETISDEQHILSVDNPKFIHGQGVKSIV